MQTAPEDADTILLKCPSDIGIRNTDRKCTLRAPDKILNGMDLPDEIHADESFPDEFNLQKSQANIAELCRELLRYGKPIISLGGDHSISFPLLNQFKQAYPDLKVCWIDAHLDIKTIGIKQGVPHDAVVRALLKKRFQPDDILFLGTRQLDPDEQHFIQNQPVQSINTAQLTNDPPDNLRQLIQQNLQLDSDTPLYLSIDIDVLDQSAAPGTTFPSENGLQPGELKDMLGIVDRFNIVGADLVEVAPPLDKNGKTVEHARNLLQQLLKLL